jgi:Trm5-related predicted tRNA methylase
VDFSGGVRGKYVGRFAKGSNVVVLDPDVAQVFTDSESVNQALRALAGIIHHQSEKTHP